MRTFDSTRLESFAFSCSECGGKVCICGEHGGWAAHCMDCANAIGKRGYYDPCADTQIEALKQWNALNGEINETDTL